VGEDDHLPAPGFLDQAGGEMVAALVVEGGDRVVEDDRAALVADPQLGEEEGGRQSGLLAGGAATATTQTVTGAGELTQVTCTGTTCVATDNQGGIFASSNGGSTWERRFGAADKLTSVSCASASLCAAVTNVGDVVKFDPLP
jgi:hypothetical protein